MPFACSGERFLQGDAELAYQLPTKPFSHVQFRPIFAREFSIFHFCSVAAASIQMRNSMGELGYPCNAAY